MRRTFAQVCLSVHNLDIVHLRANIGWYWDKHNSDCAMGRVSFSDILPTGSDSRNVAGNFKEYVYVDQYR